MSCTVTFGPMFAGKTSLALSVTRKFLLMQKRVLIVSSVLDTRSVRVLQTHDGDVLRGVTNEQCRECKVAKLQRVVEAAAQYDVIIIEEAQFFTDEHDLLQTVQTLVGDKKQVFVYGLIADADMRPFGHLLKILPIADTVEHVKSVCMICKSGAAAPFTARIDNKINSNSTATTPSHDRQIDVGSSEKYIATCRACFEAHRSVTANV